MDENQVFVFRKQTTCPKTHVTTSGRDSFSAKSLQSNSFGQYRFNTLGQKPFWAILALNKVCSTEVGCLQGSPFLQCSLFPRPPPQRHPHQDLPSTRTVLLWFFVFPCPAQNSNFFSLQIGVSLQTRERPTPPCLPRSYDGSEVTMLREATEEDHSAHASRVSECEQFIA